MQALLLHVAEDVVFALIGNQSIVVKSLLEREPCKEDHQQQRARYRHVVGLADDGNKLVPGCHTMGASSR